MTSNDIKVACCRCTLSNREAICLDENRFGQSLTSVMNDTSIAALALKTDLFAVNT